jgi:hypothetical protein
MAFWAQVSARLGRGRRRILWTGFFTCPGGRGLSEHGLLALGGALALEQRCE